jgi:phytoene dehydrogenase-like protein
MVVERACVKSRGWIATPACITLGIAPDMIDAVVIGSGPNGLVAACTLARAGWSVLVLEAQPRPGGAVYSLPTTLPGYVHDVGAAFFPFAQASPAFRSLSLGDVGLAWRTGVYESAHPAPDGTCACIARDVDRAAAAFGDDGEVWRSLARWQAGMGTRLTEALLAPLPGLRPALRLGVGNLLGLIEAGLSTAAGFACRKFRTEAARRVIPGLSLHVDLGPHDFSGAALGLVLALLAAGDGFAVPVGGARAITEAMLRRLTEAGGEVRLGTRVTRIVVRHGRAVAVATDAGEEIAFSQAVLADMGAPALYLQLLPEDDVPGWVRQSIRSFRYGWGTFKMDWALAGPVPWKCEPCRQSAVVHAGDSIADLSAFTEEVRAGRLPSNPYLVIGQQSLLDPSRAPPGGQTLWAYSRVPSRRAEGWAAAKEAFADRVEERIEGLAPGFRGLIRGRAIFAPDDLERMNENLVGGDLGGGSAHLSHQLFCRPTFPYFRYRTPVRGVYLASASAHPGAGVHGSCGYNAARAALAGAR